MFVVGIPEKTVEHAGETRRGRLRTQETRRGRLRTQVTQLVFKLSMNGAEYAARVSNEGPRGAVLHLVLDRALRLYYGKELEVNDRRGRINYARRTNDSNCSDANVDEMPRD